MQNLFLSIVCLAASIAIGTAADTLFRVNALTATAALSIIYKLFGAAVHFFNYNRAKAVSPSE